MFKIGECKCIDVDLEGGYLPRDGDSKCYQEYLQGPCAKGEQYILPDGETKPQCIQTNCPTENQVRYMDNCFPVGHCQKIEMVKFDMDTLNTTCHNIYFVRKGGGLTPSSCRASEVYSNGRCAKRRSRPSWAG